MKVLVTGSMGYEGWPTVIKLLRQGHEVISIDNGSRHALVKAVGSDSVWPINYKQRYKFAKQLGKFQHYEEGMTENNIVDFIVRKHLPDYIIHLAAQPSAPYSMVDSGVAKFTQTGNNESTMNILWAMKRYVPKATLIFASTMGVYGQPEYTIPSNGMFKPMNTRDVKGNVVQCGKEYPIPYLAGSFYHISKTLDEQNILFASKQWGLKSLILRQGVVFGVNNRGFDGPADHEINILDPALHTEAYPTRFDFDKYFGTALNRFVAQAIIGHPITLYGKGKQTRAFVTLQHCVEDLIWPIQCGSYPRQDLEGNPEIRNSVTKCFSLEELANTILYHMSVKIQHVENPRKEIEENDLVMEELPRPFSLDQEIRTMINYLLPYRDRILKYKDMII